MTTLFLSLVGCHLFVSGEIEKTCDDIPGCVDGVIATDTTGDTGGVDTQTTPVDDTGDGPTDTEPPTMDTDTAPPVDTEVPPGDRERGLVVFGVSFTKENFGLWVYNPDGTLQHELIFEEGEPDRRYDMAWDDRNQRFYVGFNDQVSVLDLESGAELAELEVEDELRELKVVNNDLWVIGKTSVGRISTNGAGNPRYDAVHEGVFTELAGGFYARERGTIELVDLDDGRPDRWEVVVASEQLTRIVDNYDTQASRSRLPFAGFDDQPWSCTTAGAVYDLNALAEGSFEPLRVLAQDTDDIIDCEYDRGSGEVVLFSSEAGVLWLGPDGSAERFALPGDYILLSGAVW